MDDILLEDMAQYYIEQKALTNEQLSDYLRLDAEQKMVYNYAKKYHPDWTHEQLIVKAHVATMRYEYETRPNYVEQKDLTDEQLSEYLRLDAEQKESYHQKKKYHPDWTHEQIITKLGLSKITDSIPIDGNKDPTKDKEYWKIVVRKLEEYMSYDFPRIYEQVKGWFSTVLEKINSWIETGIEYIGDLISALFS